MANGNITRRAALQAVAATGVVATSSHALGEQAGGTLKPLRNSDFYVDGVFSKERAFNAYYDMMRRFNYPIPPVLRSEEFWTSDFAQNDFVNVGMAGIFWINDKVNRYFAHEIFLLPGQMIVEHKHNVSVEGPAKMEAWHVRHGQIHTFGEGEPTRNLPCRLPESQLKADGITVRTCLTLNEGETASLNRLLARHFMIAGPEGAIVTEYGTPHYDDALEFTNTSVVF
jgi:D-lyxose ketol-isomerase